MCGVTVGSGAICQNECGMKIAELCLCVLPDMVSMAQELKSTFRWLEVEVALPAEQGPEILQIEDL